MKHVSKSPRFPWFRRVRFWQALTAVACLVGLPMCSGSDPGEGKTESVGSGGGTSSSGGAVGAAGFGGAIELGPRLTSEHPGWHEPVCFDCHTVDVEYPHTDESYRGPDCVGCHGFNGAAHRDHAVLENPSCPSCHASVPHIAGYDAPDDCVHCHNHPESPDGT